jgi:hypothetical protein
MVIGYKLDITLRGLVIEGTHQRWAQTNPYVDETWLRIINHRDRGHPQSRVRSREGQLIDGHYLALVWKQNDPENYRNHHLHGISPISS